LSTNSVFVHVLTALNEVLKMSAIVAWNNAVADLMTASGLNNAQAVRQLAITNKPLHAQYLAEFNQQARGDGRREDHRPPAARQPAIEHHPAPVSEQRNELATAEHAGEESINAWNDAIAELMNRGLSKAQAARELALSNKPLQAAFIAAYTAKFGEAVKHPNGQNARRRVG